MNFFEAQDRSRRNTRRLVFLYVLATLIIVAMVTSVVGVVFGQWLHSGGPSPIGAEWLARNTPLFATTALSTTGFIGLATAYKVARLSSGGSRVALDMGGSAVPSDVTDPLRRRLRNVVEEMAIASGVPVPEIFVLEEESAINAFAAGFSPDDAAIAVTRGTLESLDRDELQGVVAHEFSHILNGDMRLNIRLMGVLFGILAIGIIGRLILRGSRHGSFRSSSNDRGGAAIGVVLGIALFVIGYVGVFMGRLIKAGVSRQREFLADASAVQFTRQTDGIAGALRKIAGYSEGSRLRATDPEEISHMLFAGGIRSISAMLATHPPIEERIRALDPSFDPSRLEPVDSGTLARGVGLRDESDAITGPVSGFSGRTTVEPGDWLTHAGNPGDEHVRFAGSLRRSIPELLHAAAHSKDQSPLLAVALVLDTDQIERQRQLAFLNARLGDLRTRRIAALHEEYATLGPQYRLALLDVAFPALKDRPAAELNFLIELVDALIEMDGRVDLAEYSFARVLQGQLGDAAAPRRILRGNQRLSGNRRALTAARTLLGVFAYRGHGSQGESEAAYRAGISKLPVGPRALADWAELRPPGDWVGAMDGALDELNGLRALDKQTVLSALITVARYDAGITLGESEMLRAVASVLQCPLPPLVGDRR